MISKDSYPYELITRLLNLYCRLRSFLFISETFLRALRGERPDVAACGFTPQIVDYISEYVALILLIIHVLGR